MLYDCTVSRQPRRGLWVVVSYSGYRSLTIITRTHEPHFFSRLSTTISKTVHIGRSTARKHVDMPSAQDDGAKRRADGQASCASSAGLVDVLEMLFACRGPMPLNSATTPRRYEAPAAATSAGQADDENSSSQSGQESRSSSWGSYKYRPSRSFSKIDEEVLRELADEELGRLRAQGVVAPRAIRQGGSPCPSR